MSDLEKLLLSDDELKEYHRQLEEAGLSIDNLQIEKRQANEVIPLSSFQEPLWFIDQLMKGDNAHNVVYPMQLPEGDIDLTALKKSILMMYERHEILRTTFSYENNEVIQVVHDSMPIEINHLNLSPLPQKPKEEAGWRLIEQEAARTFDLEHGPLLEFTLLTMENDKHILVISLFHIICDTWSVSIIDREIRTLYDDIINNRPCSLLPIKIQFGDYCIWQRKKIEQKYYDDDIKFWTNKLTDAPILQLPTDYPIPENRSYPAKNQLVLIDEKLLLSIKAFAQTNNVTVYMVLLSAFKILLSKYSGLKDIVVGTPHANREIEAMQNVIGFTINSLVMRTSFAENTSFSQLVKKVKDGALSAYEHHSVPFHLLTEELKLYKTHNNMSRHSLFQAFFSMQNIQWTDTKLQQVDGNELHTKPRFTVPHPTTKYDIYMYLREREGKVIGGLEYDMELFSEKRIKNMIEHFIHILKCGVTYPEKSIGTLNLLAGEKYVEIVETLNETSKGKKVSFSISDYFKQSVNHNENNTAIREINGNKLNFDTLNKQSNKMANKLSAMGIKQNENIGILADRKNNMIVTILAIAKIGAVCIPLDPELPKDRLNYFFKEIDIKYLCCDFSISSFNLPDINIIDINADLSRYDDTLPNYNISPHQTAFVFFTSGSSGDPTGVALSHSSVLSGQLNDRAMHSLSPENSFLMTAPVSSARLIGELFWPLLSGSEIVLAPPGFHKDPEQIKAIICKENITHCCLVPELLDKLLELETFRSCRTLSTVYIVSDTLSSKTAQSILSQTKAKFFNTYGQTEAFPLAFHSINKIIDTNYVPVGEIAPNSKLYILDENMNPVPPGITGEVYIGGDNLAEAYYKKPKLTAEKFIPNPFDSHKRLYRSGDLAYWDVDHNMMLTGRVDYRVKIRGYRIDLLEVEKVLKNLDGIEEAAVVVADTEDNERRIRAFVKESNLSTQNSSAMSNMIKRWLPISQGNLKIPLSQRLQIILKEKLPIYMVPHHIIPLDHLPKLRTGKIDRAALQNMKISAQDNLDIDGQPTNEIEQKLLTIWEKAIDASNNKEKPISIYDSFFDMGGNSLTAVKIVKQVNREFNLKLEVRNIMEALTIAGLADIIDWELSNDAMADIEIDFEE